MRNHRPRCPVSPRRCVRRALHLLKQLWRSPSRHPARRPLPRSWYFEELEGRTLLSTTFTVSNTNDGGPGSFRQAILDADATLGPNTIAFTIGSGVQTIQPASPLPAITNAVLIDGTTQPGFSGAPIIVLDGSNAGPYANGLTLTAGQITVRGLVIDQFSGDGIQITTNGHNRVVDNYIGTDVTGNLARGNGGWGVDVSGGGFNTIGDTVAGSGNVISGNSQGGIRITGDTFLVSENNAARLVDPQTGTVIATYATTAASGAALYGPDGSVYIDDYYNNQILHYDASGNFLSSFGSGHLSNPQDMIVGPDGNLYVGNVDGSVQEFNLAGTFLRTFVASGSGGLNNAKGLAFGPDGNLYVASLFNNSVLRYNGTTGAFLGAFVPNGRGGLSWPEGITFGPGGNLYVSSYNTNTVLRYNGTTGAFLGTFARGGGLAQPYGLAFDARGNLDVVADDAFGQVLAYDDQTGTFLHAVVSGLASPNYLTAVTSNVTQGNVVQGNLIGTNASGSTALPNWVGIVVDASNNTIGGTGAGAGNTIADNSSQGVIIQGGHGNAIEGNAIFGNSGLGIELGGSNLVNANTGTENPTFPNAGMNYPVFTSASASGNMLTVAGYVGSAPGQAVFGGARVEIFKSDNDPSGHGQGPIYLGYLTADANGNFLGSLTVSGLGVGDKITATATDPANNSSEFSANASVIGLLGSSTTLISSRNPSVYGQVVTFTATVSAVPPGTGIPTGSVTFMDGARILGMATLSGGIARFTTTYLVAGSHAITAVYRGDAVFSGSASAVLAQTVTPAPLRVTANDASRVYGQANPSFTVRYNGFVNSDDASSLDGTLSFSTPATTGSPVGRYTITPSGLTSSNYITTFVDGTLTITLAPLTVTANDASKVYGQANPTFTVRYNGFVNGDDVSSLRGTLTFNTPANTGSPVGTYFIRPSGLTSNNYTITFVDGTLSITPAPLTVTANDASKLYGQANPTFTARSSGFVNGDNVSDLSGTLSFSTPATTGSPIGTYAITPGGLTSNNYTVTFVNGTLTITPAPLTVTANDASKVYGQVNPPFTVRYNGFVNGDDATSLGGTLTFSTPATTSSPVGTNAVTPGGLTSANYTIMFVNGTLTLTPASLTVTANDASKAYGQANPSFTARFNGFVNGDNVSSLGGTLNFSTPATAGSPVGTYAITPSGLTSSNYTITFVSGTLRIAPAPLTVTANNASKVYGQTNPTFTVRYNGFVNGDNAGSLGGTRNLSTSATTGSPVGMYAITPSGLTSSNYAITFVNGTLTIMPAVLTVTAQNATKAYGQADPDFAVSYAGFVNGDNAGSLGGTLNFSTPATAGSPVGSYAITPGSLTSSNYAMTFVNGILAITPAALTVTATDANRGYGYTNSGFTASYGGFVNSDSAGSLGGTLNFTTPATTGSPVGTYFLTPGGLTSSNYTITFVNGTLTITPAPLTVIAGSASKVYGQPNPSFAATYERFVNGDTVASLGGTLRFTTDSATGSPVGTYAITPSGLTSSNYAITFVNGTVTVMPAPPTVTVNPVPAIQASGNPALSVPNSGPINPNGSSLLLGSPHVSILPTGSVSFRAGPGRNNPAREAYAPPSAAGPEIPALPPAPPPSTAPAEPTAVAPNQVPMPALPTVRPPQPPAPINVPPAMPALPGPQAALPSRLDALQRRIARQAEFLEENRHKFTEGSTTWPKAVTAFFATTAVASAGYAILSSRAAVWLLSLLMARPLWRHFDPIEILFAWELEKEERKKRNPSVEEEDESLQALVHS